MHIDIEGEAARSIQEALGLNAASSSQSKILVFEDGGNILISTLVEENLVSLAFSITGIQLTRGNIQKRETAVVTHGSNTAITFVQGEPNSYKEDESGEQAKAIRAMAAQVYAAVKPCLPYAFH